jgi:hypothetical protein
MAITNQQLHSELQDLKNGLKDMVSHREMEFYNARLIELEKWRDEMTKSNSTKLEAMNGEIQTIRNQVTSLSKDIGLAIKIMSVIGSGFILSFIGVGLNFLSQHMHFF